MDSKWIIRFSFLLGVLCNCQEGPLVNLEETGVISCSSDNFEAVNIDIVKMRAGEPDKEICLDPDYKPSTFPFYHTVSCESQSPTLTRQLLMYSVDIQLFEGLGGEFCLEERNSSDGNEQLLLGMNLAGISREKRNFSLKLVCRAVGTSGSGGAAEETSALIEPRNTTSLTFIPQGQNGSVTTEKGVPVKIAVLVALPDELKNVNTSWSDSRITCDFDADVEVPKCVYTSQVGFQETWSCSITTNKSDVYTFQHRGTSYIVRLTVYDPTSTDPPTPGAFPQDMTAIIAGVIVPVIIIVSLIAIIIVAIVAVHCYSGRKRGEKLDDIKTIAAKNNAEIAKLTMANGQSYQPPSQPQSSAETTLDAPPITESEDRGQLPTVEESDDPTLDVAEKSGVDPCSNLNVKLDDQRYSRGSITESNVNEAKVIIANNGHPPTETPDRVVQNEDKSSGIDQHIPVQNGHLLASTA